MKKLFITLCLTVTCVLAAAQDVLLKKNADEIQAKVLKVGKTEIEYKKWGNLEGPTYTIPADEVFTIKYQNGSKDVISAISSSSHNKTGVRASYQGEMAVGFGLGVGVASQFINTDRFVFETVHGVRINPYVFVGAGAGVNYFKEKMKFFDSTGREIGVYDGAAVVPAFINLKGGYPISQKSAVYLSLDLGAAFGVAGWAKGTEFYTSIGPGIDFGSKTGSPRANFSIRFQHMGEGTNAVLFRIGLGF